MRSDARAVPAALQTGLVGALVAVVVATLVSLRYPAPWTLVLLAGALGALPAVLAAVAVTRRSPRTVTIADRVTLARAVLASACAASAVLIVFGEVPARTWWLVALVIPTLILDAVDGYVARRTGTVTEAGALLDMQLDAGVLVVLSVAAAPVLGQWVLTIGALRYLFVGASWCWPTLREPLPRSQFRRVVAALQGAALTLPLAPVVPPGVASLAVALALVLLLASFSSQVVLQVRAVHGESLAAERYEAGSGATSSPIQAATSLGSRSRAASPMASSHQI